ncbi:hypothetical protein LCGC14_1508260 [marine sediment metagenome]|uniref:Uncharacterized protein n=1 Tax=marine sediment metagenome TaxID=412755 RepID=A0A0F9LHI8_9ZZZZ
MDGSISDKDGCGLTIILNVNYTKLYINDNYCYRAKLGDKENWEQRKNH